MGMGHVFYSTKPSLALALPFATAAAAAATAAAGTAGTVSPTSPISAFVIVRCSCPCHPHCPPLACPPSASSSVLGRRAWRVVLALAAVDPKKVDIVALHLQLRFYPLLHLLYLEVEEEQQLLL